MSKYRLWLLGIILIAFIIRLHNLTYHSLWFDEAISVYWARQSVPRILEVGFTLVEDRLPPLYYLTLKGWTARFGLSETSVRLPSVFYGVLLVPMVGAIAANLFNRRVALTAGLLAAFNPFLTWYAQEARMYAPAVFFATLTVWAFLHLVNALNQKKSPPLQFAIIFILAAIAGLYSHLYAGFLLPALGLWLMISYPRQWRLWLLFALCGLIIAAAFAPLTLAIWRFSGEADPARAPLARLGPQAWRLLQAFTVWKAPLSTALTFLIPTAVTLFALVAYAPISRSKLHTSPYKYPRQLMSLLLLIPFLIAVLLLYRNHLALFGERYLIVVLPWLLILAAVGADNLSQWIKGTGLSAKRFPSKFHFIPFTVLLILTALPLPGQWSIPAAKEAWRQSVAYLARHAGPDDAILIHPDWVRHPFQFYFRGPGQTYAAFNNVTPETSLDGPLQGVINNHALVWLIQSHLDGPDPQRLVEQWFGARYPLVTELYPPGINLKAYAPGYQLGALAPDATPVDFEFKNGMRLVGYQADRSTLATDRLFHPPSGWLHVTLYWTATQRITAETRPFVHLLGSEGVWGVNLERPNDALKLFPPTGWPPNMIIRHDLDVNLNPLTPPGHYQLVLGLEGIQSRYPLGEVEVK